ncbi:MAG: NAD(P)H-dependent oxidoreductase [Bacteroidaceae bacterium]|nr:NAD(P)H-dependent oxidoreductase [Bacteroidaceae bacterium]
MAVCEFRRTFAPENKKERKKLCISQTPCKIKGGRKGVCSFRDDLQPIMEKVMEADVLVCGSPVYCGYPS